MYYFVKCDTGKKDFRWKPDIVYKRNDHLKSSDFPDYTPPFVPSYEKTCCHNMNELLGNEYSRQWHRELPCWQAKVYPTQERCFFNRRFVIRDYHKRCPQPPKKTKCSHLRQFSNVPARTCSWWTCPPRRAPVCLCPRKPVGKPVCCTHRRPRNPCPIIPDVTPRNASLSMGKCSPCIDNEGFKLPLSEGFKPLVTGPRGQTGPRGCGIFGGPPCGPAGARRDRGPFPQEPVCTMPKEDKGPNPAWFPHGVPEEPEVCDIEGGKVCHPPCEYVCVEMCAQCGCAKPCQCERRKRAAAATARGVCATRKAPCPTRPKDKPCADTCAEPCKTEREERIREFKFKYEKELEKEAKRQEREKMLGKGISPSVLDFPCPCVPSGKAGGAAAAPKDDKDQPPKDQATDVATQAVEDLIERAEQSHQKGAGGSESMAEEVVKEILGKAFG